MILNTGAGAVLPPPPLIHISLLPHYHQTHLAGTNILKDILSRHMETFSSKVYVHIVSFGSGCARLPNVDSILFVSHYSTPANTSLLLPKPPIFGPSVGYCFFAFYFYYITTPSEQHLEFWQCISTLFWSAITCFRFRIAVFVMWMYLDILQPKCFGAKL